VPDWTCGSFAGYARRTAASKERNAGRGAIWQHLPVIYPCHLPMLVFWLGPCSSHACGVDGRRTSRRQQHRCEALDTVCLTSQAGMMYGLQVMDQVDISVDARASHDTPRCEARRGAFQRPSHCCPRKHYSTTHAWAGRVWQGPLFRRASSSERLTASYLTRPWSLRLELTSWLEARSASTPCPLLLAGVHIAVASTGCVSPRAGRRSSDWHVSSRGQVSIAQDGVSRGRCHCPAQVHVGVDVCALRYM
jgi:hypothetical protein